MRILFATQSNSLRMFDSLRVALQRRGLVERCGFTVADSWAYQSWIKDHPDFERKGHLLLKEWEITSQRSGKPDLVLLTKYERELGDAGLFGAIVADRRLFMGPRCTYSQDYRRRFADDELLCILQAAVTAVDQAFEELKPNLVLSFVCVTIMDYLTYLFAKARGVRLLNLRPSRIADRVIYGSTLMDPAPELLKRYTCYLQNGSDRVDEARAYIDKVRKLHGRYEGIVRPSAKPAQTVGYTRNPFTAAAKLWQQHRAYKVSISAKDNHVPGIMPPLLFRTIINPWRAWYAKREFSRYYVTPKDLEGRRYTFYPLHTEPEVSLLVYARPFFNQLEVIRALATSLPADMVLVVKEHPWMVGKRSISVYRKMLNIPRVRLARPEIEAREFVKHASLVTVVASSVGLEAAMLQCPVLTLGHCIFNVLPETMVRRCRDLTLLPQTIRDLLENHSHDEHSLEAFVAAVLKLSAGVNLYSVLLGRTGVHSERNTEFDFEIERLADYTWERLKEPEDAYTANSCISV